MKRILTTVLFLVCSSVWAGTLNVGSASQWQAAKPQAGDTVLLTADISLPCDTPLMSNVTYDLGGHAVTFPRFLPDGVRPSRGFCVDGGGVTVRNGTVRDAGWAFYAFYSGKGWAFRDLKCEGVKTFLKLSATPNAVSDGIDVRNVTVTCRDAQYTIFDIGPGRCSGVYVDGYRSYAPVGTDNNTGADGLALENPTDTPVLKNVVIDGAAGDGLDIKGPADLYNVYVTHCARQTIKVWGKKDAPTSMVKCVGVQSGMGGMCNSGKVSQSECYFEGGSSDSTAFFWGVGKVYDPTKTDQWGNPDVYGCGGVTATVVRCKFIRHAGTSVLLTAEAGAALTFTDCQFWQINHPNLFTGPFYVATDKAKAGVWPSNFVNATYADSPVPDIPGAVVEPPTPPAWTLTEADWNALVASNKAAIQRIAVLEDRLKAVAAALQ